MTNDTSSEGPILSIALQRDLLLGDWYVTRVDIEAGVIKNQTRFKAPVPIDHAFGAPFLGVIQPHLPVQPQSNVYVDDAAQFALPSLVLNGIRVVAQRAFDGVQTVVIRFRQAIGTVQTLYRPEYQLTELSKTTALPSA